MRNMLKQKDLLTVFNLAQTIGTGMTRVLKSFFFSSSFSLKNDLNTRFLLSE